MRYKILLGCLVLSGFCGLAYELLWTRLLSFTFGSTTMSFAAVLAVFFGGLALGAWVAGKKAAALCRPVRTYGLIEIGTGLAGLALYPAMLHLDRVFVSIDPGSGLAGAMVRLAVSAPLLLVPTFLMGATLPVVCAAMIHRDEDVGRGSALIYGFNTLGAFLGAYLVTYHLIPGMGLFLSNVLTVGVNFFVGGLALLVERRGRVGQVVEEKEELVETDSAVNAAVATDAAAPSRVFPVATVLTFLSGFAFISYEVVWSRLFSAFLQGTVYGVGAVLICFLVGIAVGSLLIARRIPESSDIGLWFAALQTVTVGSVLVLCRGLARIAHILETIGAEQSDSLIPQHEQLLVVFAVLAVPTFSSGASFPLLVKIVESGARRTGRTLGSLYAANTVGSILGSLITGFVLIPQLGSVGAVALATAVVGLSAALGGALLATGRRRLVGLAVAGVALLLVGRYEGFDVNLITVAASPQKELYERYSERTERDRKALVYFAEGRDGTIAVYDFPDNRTMRINGLGQGSRSKWPPHHLLESLLVGMIPLVHVEAPERTLVVGLGAGITIDLLAELGVRHIEVVEIEPRVVDAVNAVFYGNSPLHSEAVDVVTDDARHHLLLGAGRDSPTYDVITSMPAHPWVSPGLFTREFFELARANLRPGGVFSTWFGTGKMDRAAVESLFRAFCSVFDHYIIYHVPEVFAYYLVGAEGPLSIDMERLGALHRRRSVGEHPALSDVYFLPSRIYAVGDGRQPLPPEGVVNTDDTAFVEVHAPRSSGSAPIFRGFLPCEYLIPSMLSGDHRLVYLELLNHLLGTPGGRLPLSQLRVAPRRAQATLEAARGWLTREEATYFEARIAMATNRVDEARRLFEAVAGDGGEIGGRARKFSAMLEPPGSKARLDALLALDVSTDVVLEVMELDGELALELVPDREVDAESDPVGWFLWKAATVEPGGLTAEDRATFTRQAGQRLGRSTRQALLIAAERFAAGQGLDQEAEILNRHRRSLASAEARRLVELGVAAGAQGRFEEAADVLWEAHRLEPADEIIMRPLLLALVETGAEERTAELLDEFRFIGRSESHIQALLEDARSGMLVFSAAPEVEPLGAEGDAASESRP